MELTAVFVRSGEWWAATIEEIPGVNTQGKTLEEARSNLQEALQMILEARREEIGDFASGEQVIRERFELSA